MKCGENLSKKKTSKDYAILYMYIAHGQGKITLRENILTVTKTNVLL